MEQLSRRERQIMDALFRLGRATAAEVREAMPEPPSYSAVRAQLRTLEEKGHLRHEEDGPRYVYVPKTRPDHARKRALAHLIDTFFGGSAADAAAALLDTKRLGEEEITRLQQRIDLARKEGR